MQETRPRRPGEAVFAVLLLLASLVVLHQAYAIAGFSSLSSAGVFPMLAGATMVGTMAAVVVNLWRTRSAEPVAAEDQLRRFGREVMPIVIIAFVGLIIAYMLALEQVGFLISSMAFLFLSIWFLDRKGPLRALIISAGALAVIYVIFRLIFRVLLP
jgi:hypothetical protein